MKYKTFNIIYGVILVLIILSLLIFENLSSSIQILLGSTLIILTSFFSYTNKDAIFRKKHQKRDS